MFKEFYTNCECFSFLHLIRWSYFPLDPSIKDDECSDLYLNIIMESGTFRKRLIRGLKYIFGLHSRHGHFTEVILNEKTIKDLQEFLNKYLEELHNNRLREI